MEDCKNVIVTNDVVINNDIHIINDNEHIIGIDLGTTNTCVGIWRNECLEIIPDEYGNRTIPSFVAFTNVSRYIGLDAKNQKDLNPLNVFYEIKRLIGRKINDPLVTREKEFFSYKIDGDENNNIILKPDIENKKTITVEEISAAILTKAKYMASNYLSQKITKCVITIPAYFNDGQRQATKDAATIAGLECIRIINEPTAAALAYGLLERTQNDVAKNIIVYDFGGGTLDVSMVRIEGGIFEVLSSCGNMRMGGSDFDNRLMSYAMGKFKKQNNIDDISELSSISLQKLRSACEQAKKILTASTKTQIAIKNFYNDIDLFIPITRTDFEKMCTDLFLIALKPIDDVLNNCDYDISEIDEIILVGGMTRMPKIRDLIKIKCGKDPNCSINPDEAVAAGAAIQGYLLSHSDDPFSEAITLLDTTSLSLGVETTGGIMDVIIERNNIIPTSESKEYSTDKDHVESVLIKIYEGERRLTCDNFFVGEFELCGIKPEPRGMPEIIVTFNIDNNGIITVMAENKKNNEKNSLTVTSNKGRLTKNQIDELVHEAKSFEMRDELEKRKKFLHYEIDEFCNNILVNIENQKEFKLADKDRKMIKQDILNVMKWLSEKKSEDRDDADYEKVIETIKKQYGVLILTGCMEENNVQSVESSYKDATNIYDEDTDACNIEQVFENIEEEQRGYKGFSESEKSELKELRQAILDLCYSIFDILSNDNTQISKEHSTELKNYVDDALLWLHVHEKPNKIEYKMKIDQINEICNKIFNSYDNNIFKTDTLISSIKTHRDELENLCITLMLMIEDNAFTINSDILKPFTTHIEKTMLWISENDIENVTTDDYYNECKTRLDELNEYCGEIHQKMIGLNINKSFDILGTERITVLNENNKEISDTIADKKSIEKYMNIMPDSDSEDDDYTGGTDIITLMQQKQQNILSAMINEI